MNKLTAIVIGCGARGGETYIRYAYEHHNIDIVAICDTDSNKLDYYSNLLGLSPDSCYSDAQLLLQQGKVADIAIVAVFDQQHYGYTMRCIDLGYDILLEKPISNSLQESINIRDHAVAKGVSITVCHVMRYTSYYRKLKQLLVDGAIGQIVAIEQTEDVASWHMAHAFVRGNFNNSYQTSPMILQKCCHDMDLLVYLADQAPLSVSSMGSLRHFHRGNAPMNSTEYCYQCGNKSCPYNAQEFYLGNAQSNIDAGKSIDCWPYTQVVDNPTIDRLRTALTTSKFGRCVYKSDNNVVDHQFSLVQFDGGIVGTLTMIGFSKDGGRQTHVYGTMGEIYLDEQKATIVVSPFNADTYTIPFSQLASDFSGHGGGDKVMMDEFVAKLSGKQEGANLSSDIVTSLHSHIMCHCAEQSRIKGGQLVHCKI